ncbi:LysE family transporter [Rubellimicrobium aerolatum]|uniref:LysE family transporter n=1 Tax=Rubellimicrobium aerolatum TaxID=490979 RepID=A0ABW0S873_9RHOB|nr:LysE family transporter [Rubellimicrobium aerolatum]MBP1804328.1 threonine/homoserine/homoserine lactone efflux protein [Rubellimicrobium aerolatum]
MTPIETALAICALLVTPGPTNTLMAIAGAERGWRRAIRLVPAELCAYLATTLPLALLGAALLARAPQAKVAVTALAALWVGWLAVAMWRVPPARAGVVTVTARRVAVTTLLNPKALIFGLVLLPGPDGGLDGGPDGARLGANVAIFAAEVVAVALLWAGLGAALRRGGRQEPGLPAPWRRAASVWLGALAVYLMGRVVGLA